MIQQGYIDKGIINKIKKWMIEIENNWCLGMTIMCLCKTVMQLITVYGLDC